MSAAPGVGLATRPAAHLVKADLRSPATMLAAERRIASDRMARLALAGGGGAGCFGCPGDDINAIADVNHDGVADLLATRITGPQSQVLVYSGRTGKVLWRLADRNLVSAVYVSSPGAGGRVVTFSGVFAETDTPAAGVVDATLTITGRDPATGAQKWSVPLEGRVEYDEADELVVQFPEFDGVLNRAHASPLLLLDKATVQFGLVEGVFTIQPLTIDTATGATVSNGSPVGSDGFAYAMPMGGDVTGDGTDDFLSATWGDAAVGTVVSGATAQPVWSTQPSPNDFGVGFAWTSPDINGDGKPDVLMGIGSNTPRVQAFSGPTGTSIWSAPGEYAEPVGDVDGDHRSDTRIFTFLEGSQSFTLVNARGQSRWTRTVTSSDDVAQWTFAVGDVDGDHIADIYLRVLTRDQVQKQAAGVEGVVISGKTGAVRKFADLGWPLMMPNGATKFLRAVRVKNGMALSAYDGRTGRALWATTIGLSGAQRLAAWTVAAAGHRAILVTMIQGTQRNLLAAQDWATGQLNWRLTYANGTGIVIK